MLAPGNMFPHHLLVAVLFPGGCSFLMSGDSREKGIWCVYEPVYSMESKTSQCWK